MQVDEYTAAWVALEILGGVDAVTREGDVFAFGMVVIEVCPRPSLHLASEVEGWMDRLTSECCPRFLREGSVNLQSHQQNRTHFLSL